jgi:hypothetical protein
VDPDNRQTNYTIGLINGTLTVTVLGANFTSMELSGPVLQMVLSAEVGLNYALERSTNLLSKWTPLATNAVTLNGTINFSDTPGTNNSKSLFYRARLVP